MDKPALDATTDALDETTYLLRKTVGVERLLASIERARRGEFEQHDLAASE